MAGWSRGIRPVAWGPGCVGFYPRFALAIPMKLTFMSTECLPGTFLSIFHVFILRTVLSELWTALLPTHQ